MNAENLDSSGASKPAVAVAMGLELVPSNSLVPVTG
jgi:hypothetical protein